MDLRSLRALATGLNFSTHGVPVTVTWPDPENAPVTTTGIWGQVLEEDQPVAADFRRREPRRSMALPRNVIATLPRGTIILAPEQAGELAKTWKVDGLGRTDSECWRAVLVLVSGPP